MQAGGASPIFKSIDTFNTESFMNLARAVTPTGDLGDNVAGPLAPFHHRGEGMEGEEEDDEEEREYESRSPSPPHTVFSGQNIRLETGGYGHCVFIIIYYFYLRTNIDLDNTQDVMVPQGGSKKIIIQKHVT